MRALDTGKCTYSDDSVDVILLPPLKEIIKHESCFFLIEFSRPQEAK
jgi:hypothetical protein